MIAQLSDLIGEAVRAALADQDEMVRWDVALSLAPDPNGTGHQIGVMLIYIAIPSAAQIGAWHGECVITPITAMDEPTAQRTVAATLGRCKATRASALAAQQGPLGNGQRGGLQWPPN